MKYLNLPIEKIKAAAILQLKDGHPVWFGSDCMKYRLNTEGVFDPDSLPMDRFLNVPFTLTKGERLTYWDSAMDHAMVFLGVNLNGDDKPDRWRIENSWGEESGLNKGYWIASDKWFNEYVYQIAINKKYLSPEDQALLSQPVIELDTDVPAPAGRPFGVVNVPAPSDRPFGCAQIFRCRRAGHSAACKHTGAAGRRNRIIHKLTARKADRKNAF